jgi:hypothetical protein
MEKKTAALRGGLVRAAVDGTAHCESSQTFPGAASMRYGQVTPAHVGAAPGVEVPIAVAQSEAVRISHVPGVPATPDGTQHATGAVHPLHTLPVPDTKPPRPVHAVAARLMCGPLNSVQSASVVQVAPLLLHVPVVHVPVLVTVQQSTRFGFPQVERAAQLVMSAVGQPSLRSWLRV